MEKAAENIQVVHGPGAAGGKVYCVSPSDSSWEASGNFSVPTVQMTSKGGPKK